MISTNMQRFLDVSRCWISFSLTMLAARCIQANYAEDAERDQGRIPRHRRPCEDVGVSARILAMTSVSVSWNAAFEELANGRPALLPRPPQSDTSAERQ